MRALVLPALAAGFATVVSAETLPFPLVAVAEQSASVQLDQERSAVVALGAFEELRLTDVPVPGQEPVELVLERLRVTLPSTTVWVDGRPTSGFEVGATFWTGHVAGEPQSNAFFAFSPHGSRGWIDSSAGLVHLLAHPDAAQGWEAPRGTLITDVELRASGHEPTITCANEELEVKGKPVAAVPRIAGPPTAAAGSSPLPIYNGRIAVETDYQFYQLFNNLSAAQNYAFTLFAAVSARYREQLGVILTAPHFAFYTSNNDPWTEQDAVFGASCIDVLFEFQEAWNFGQAPVDADIYHMFSGAPLGCGVAWLDVLCDDEFNFSVSGHMDGGTPFPIAQGPINWDFIVVAHELGHNFGTPHTHDYCPPIDECAPDGYFGYCQGGQSCISDGTLMSYCHLCSGGYDNITTFFHPDTLDVMRTSVEASCLELFAGVLPQDLGNSLAGPSGTPSLQVSYDTGTLHHVTTNAPSSAAGVLIWSLDTAFSPLFGGILVPVPDYFVAVTSNAGGFSDLTAMPTGSFPSGIHIITQTWWLDGVSAAASNGVDYELITP